MILSVMCGDPQGTYSKIAANLKQLLQIKKTKHITVLVNRKTQNMRAN